MKMFKKLFAVFLALLVVLSMSACVKDKPDAHGEPSVTTTEATATKPNGSEVNNPTVPATENNNESNVAVQNDGYEKFAQLKIGMTEAEVNAILGEPSKVDKAYYNYIITVNGQDMEIDVWINTVSGQVTFINANDFIDYQFRSALVNAETDLSSARDLQSGALATYEDCVTAFKTPGFLISIDDAGTTDYLWVDSDDGYMRVTFKADGTVKSYSGVC